jgi:hypothetical protein
MSHAMSGARFIETQQAIHARRPHGMAVRQAHAPIAETRGALGKRELDPFGLQLVLR